jgi:hypothetical protein
MPPLAELKLFHSQIPWPVWMHSGESQHALFTSSETR